MAAPLQQNTVPVLCITIVLATSLHVVGNCSSNLTRQELYNPNHEGLSPDSSVVESSGEVDLSKFSRHLLRESSNDFLKQQAALMGRLEGLMGNLSRIVSNLNTNLSDPRREKATEENALKGGANFSSGRWIEDEHKKTHIDDDDRALERNVSARRYSPIWSDRFPFISAVKIDTEATSICILPFRDRDGVRKYIAVGCNDGGVFLLEKNGDLVLAVVSLSNSPVTSMVSYLVSPSETMLVTGHKNGAINAQRVFEVNASLTVTREIHLSQDKNPDSEITVLETHQVWGSRYILSADITGLIMAFKEDGAFHGSIRPSSRTLLFSSKQHLWFLTEKGAGSLDPSSMSIAETECDGLNGSTLQVYALDSDETSRAYGFTREGHLVHIFFSTDGSRVTCAVRSRRKTGVGAGASVALQYINGHLLLANRYMLFAYNVTCSRFVVCPAPKFLFSHQLRDIKSLFLSNAETTGSGGNHSTTSGIPLLATDREKLVIIGLASGFIGIYYQSVSLIYNGLFTTSMLFMAGCVLVAVIILTAICHYWYEKDASLAPLGIDLSFSVLRAMAKAEAENPQLYADSLSDTEEGLSPKLLPSSRANQMPSSSANPVSDPGARLLDASAESAPVPRKRENLFLNGARNRDIPLA